AVAGAVILYNSGNTSDNTSSNSDKFGTSSINILARLRRRQDRTLKRNEQMSEAGAIAAQAAHEIHHTELGFLRTYIFSSDHKMIGKQFLFLSLVMLVFGGFMAMLIRWELAWPETPLPFIGASQQFIEKGEPQTVMDKNWQEWLSKD